MTDIPGGIEQSASERYCHNCGAPNPSDYNFCLRCGARINLLRPLPTAPLRPPGGYPLFFDVEYPEKLSRLKTLGRLFLAVPQFLVIYALGTVVGIITLIAWFAILFTRRYPKGLFDLVVGFNRWIANVYVYAALLRDEYPPFSMDPGHYAVAYEVDYPERLSRWLIFVKWFLVLVHQIVLQFIGLFAFFADVIAWFAILITGRFPRSLFNFIVGVMRWNLRVSAYSSLLRDEFPPFSKRANAGPGSGRAVALSAVLALPLVGALVGVYVAAFLAFGSLTSSTEEVSVRYAQVLAGNPTAPVEVDGNFVVLLSAEDPVDFTVGFRTPETGHHFVQFEVQVTNVDSFFTSVSDETFRLKDTRDRDHDPIFVQSPTFGDDQVEQGLRERVSVTFELRNDADPLELTYSPGLAAFLPIGEKVRFKFDGRQATSPSARARAPSPTTTPKAYEISVRVDFGETVPQSGPVELDGLTLGPIEVEDPHPSFARASLADRPPDSGARYIALYLPIENVDASTLVITADNFNLSDTVAGGGQTPDFLTFGAYPRDELTLGPQSVTLVGLVYELDSRTDPEGLTYFPQFEDPFAESHNIHFEFR